VPGEARLLIGVERLGEFHIRRPARSLKFAGERRVQRTRAADVGLALTATSRRCPDFQGSATPWACR